MLLGMTISPWLKNQHSFHSETAELVNCLVICPCFFIVQLWLQLISPEKEHAPWPAETSFLSYNWRWDSSLVVKDTLFQAVRGGYKQPAAGWGACELGHVLSVFSCPPRHGGRCQVCKRSLFCLTWKDPLSFRAFGEYHGDKCMRSDVTL